MNKAVIYFFGFGLLGVFVFFVPISIDGRETIPLDHMVHACRKHFPLPSVILVSCLLIWGAISPFIRKDWDRSLSRKIFSILGLMALLPTTLALTGWGPEFLQQPGMLPFLFEKLIIPVGLIVPIGSVFLAFLVSYGLLETVGTLVDRLMRPIWHTPGRSAIDAVASFVGSYSIGLLITNRMLTEGRYTNREACIIATGFSTVSVTFMVIVARQLELMSRWNLWFWSTMGITFLVTAITVRLPPLSRGAGERSKSSRNHSGNLMKRSLHVGLQTAGRAPAPYKSVRDNIRDGLNMASAILPMIMSVGLLGLLLAEYTPVFDWIGLVFQPFCHLAGIPEPQLAARAAATGLAEMFLPALVVGDAPLMTRYVVGVVSISTILFFSASIPCIMATKIRISVGTMVIIWAERLILSIIFAGLLAGPLGFA